MWREAKVILYKTLTKSHVLYSLGMYALLIYSFDLAPARYRSLLEFSTCLPFLLFKKKVPGMPISRILLFFE